MTPTPKQPISEKRLAANRANAARSTGPCTEEGKTRSAQNARKHGFTAAKFVVDGLEDSETLDNLRADAIAVYRPANSQELFAVERIVLAQQSMLRCFALEAGLHSAALTTPGVDPNLCLAIGFIQEAANWRLFLRYQAQAERQYRRAVEELE